MGRKETNICKDQSCLRDYYEQMPESDKVNLLNEMMSVRILNGNADILNMSKTKMIKDVERVMMPFMAESSSIVVYCPSRDYYKARIPKPLQREGQPQALYALCAN